MHDTGGASGFKREELPSIFDCMSTAIELSEVGNMAIIVDPSSMQIISKATDQTHQHDGFVKRNRCVNVEAEGVRSLAETTEDNDGRLLLSSSHVIHCFNLEVSCINSWGWTKQRSSEQKTLSSEGGFTWHPLRHAAIVAIENAAERDRMLFHTSTSPTAEPNLNGDMQNCSDNEPAKLPKIVTKIENKLSIKNAGVTCLEQTDHISAQDSTSTLFGNPAQSVLWLLYIKHSSASSTLSLIQSLERWAVSIDCMGRKV